MLKDNENVPFPIVPDTAEETIRAQPFAQDQMLRCETCQRLNAPTRVNCIYCGSALPSNESTFNLQRPTLRRLEKWELGYNNILALTSANAPEDPSEHELAEAADLLKLAQPVLARILSFGLPLPLARAATIEEASLVERRLRSLKIETHIVSDIETGFDEKGALKVRWMEIDEGGIRLYQNAESASVGIEWNELLMIVTGRLMTTRVEMKEKKASSSENRIVDSSEFVNDELVMDLFTKGRTNGFRVAANSFDFSCLGRRKQLVSENNLTTLIGLLGERAPHLRVDRSYDAARKSLEGVWPSESQYESSGWRRERLGKYTIGTVSGKSNELQFQRYSLLRRYLLQREAIGE